MQHDPDQLHIDRTRRFFTLFGCLPMLGGGVFLLFSILCLVLSLLLSAGLVRGDSNQPAMFLAMFLVMLLMGALLLLAGAAVFFARLGTTLDRRRQTVTRWWGIGWLKRRSTADLPQVDRVEIWRRVVRGKGHTTYFPVQLQGTGEPVTILYWEKDETRARAVADQVAQFLQLELHDKIGAIGEPADAAEVVIRRPAEIGVPVGQRIQSGLETLPLPPRPQRMISEFEELPDGVLVTLPRQGFSAPIAALAAFSMIPILFLLLGPAIALRHDPFPGEDLPHARLSESPFAVCLFLPGVVVAGGMAVLLIGSARTRMQIRITRQEVRVSGGLWKTVIPQQQLEEVRVTGKGSNWLTPCFVTVRSASAKAQCGGNQMTRDECEYLAAVIKAIAAA